MKRAPQQWRWRSLRRGASAGALAWLCVVAASGSGCRRDEKTESASGRSDASETVAEIDGRAITTDDLMRDMSNRSPYYRLQARSADGKKKMVEALIRFELMAKEARDRGYEKDPNVVRTMKQQMINQMVEDETKGIRVTISDEAVERYYTAHAAEFSEPERVGVAEIVVRDKARAAAAYSAATAIRPSDAPGFRALVARVSEDEATRKRGGELEPFDRQSRNVPRAIVEAAFKLATPGTLSTPIETDGTFVILRLTERVPPGTKPLGQVRNQIEQRVASESRAKTMQEWADKLREKHSIKIFDDSVERMNLDPIASESRSAGRAAKPH